MTSPIQFLLDNEAIGDFLAGNERLQFTLATERMLGVSEQTLTEMVCALMAAPDKHILEDLSPSEQAATARFFDLYDKAVRERTPHGWQGGSEVPQ